MIVARARLLPARSTGTRCCCFSITALPMLGRMLIDLGMPRKPLGVISPWMFTAPVLMATVSTVATTPLSRLRMAVARREARASMDLDAPAVNKAVR